MLSKHLFPILGLIQTLLIAVICFGGLAGSKSAVVYGTFGFVIALGLTAYVAHFSGDDK